MITEHRVPQLIPVLGSQPAVDVNHKPNGRLPLLSAWPTVTPAILKEGCYQFCCLVNRGTMGVNSLPKTVTRQQRCDCNLNLGPSAPESSTLATRLPSHCAVSMQIRVYGLVSVCLSVCPIRPPHSTAVDLVNRRYRSVAAWHSAVAVLRPVTEHSSGCKQCHVVS